MRNCCCYGIWAGWAGSASGRLQVLICVPAMRHFPNPPACRYIRIDGTTPASKRQSLVNDFQQNEGECQWMRLLGRALGMVAWPPPGAPWRRVGGSVEARAHPARDCLRMGCGPTCRLQHWRNSTQLT